MTSGYLNLSAVLNFKSAVELTVTSVSKTSNYCDGHRVFCPSKNHPSPEFIAGELGLNVAKSGNQVHTKRVEEIRRNPSAPVKSGRGD